MRFLNLFTTTVLALNAVVSAVSLPVTDQSTDTLTLIHPLLRRVNTAAYDKVHAAHANLVPGTQYAFQLEWGNGGDDYVSPELKAYCERLGFKHRAMLVGHVTGGGRRPLDFTGKVYDLVKGKTDKGVSTSPGRTWTPRRETVKFLGQVRSGITDGQIVAAGRCLYLFPLGASFGMSYPFSVHLVHDTDTVCRQRSYWDTALSDGPMGLLNLCNRGVSKNPSIK